MTLPTLMGSSVDSQTFALPVTEIFDLPNKSCEVTGIERTL